MAIDLNEIIAQWSTARSLGSHMSQLAQDAQTAFIKADGTPQAPHPDTIADIKTEFIGLIPKFETALLAMRDAYTP